MTQTQLCLALWMAVKELPKAGHESYFLTCYVLLVTCYFLIVTCYSLLVTRYLLLVTCYSLLVIRYSFLVIVTLILE
jgi:hypothetical protein